MVKFERLLLELNLIRSRPGVKASELASETGVSQRTIYRDILNLAGQYPVIYNGGYRLLPTAYLRTLNFTHSEYGLLQTALSCPAFRRIGLKTVARSLKAKIDTVINPGLRNFPPAFSHSCAAMVPQDSNPRKLEGICSTLEKAIENSLAVELLLDNNPSGQSEAVHPYALLYRPPDWFLVGYSPLKGSFEGYRLSSASRVSLSNQSFQKREDFNLDEFLGSRWGIKGGEETVVKVRFTGEAARLICSTGHHPREKVTQVSENEVVYTLTVQGTEEICKWILSFGAEAEVLAPFSLREEIKQKINGLSELYHQGKAKLASFVTPMAQTGNVSKVRHRIHTVASELAR